MENKPKFTEGHDPYAIEATESGSYITLKDGFPKIAKDSKVVAIYSSIPQKKATIMDVLIRVASLGLSLHFEREGQQMGIVVKHITTKIQCMQLLPIDHHLRDERLFECINFCIAKVLHDVETHRVVPVIKKDWFR